MEESADAASDMPNTSLIVVDRPAIAGKSRSCAQWRGGAWYLRARRHDYQRKANACMTCPKSLVPRGHSEVRVGKLFITHLKIS